LTEGFLGELKSRDSELAALRAASALASDAVVHSGGQGEDGASPTVSATASAAGDVAAEGTVDVLTITEPGPLGVEFDRTNIALKIVSAVESGSVGSGRLLAGDEILSVDGVSARSYSWSEWDEALTQRPAVISVRRGEIYVAAHAQGAGIRLANRVRDIAGWTRSAAKAAARELEAAMADLEEDATQSSVGASAVAGAAGEGSEPGIALDGAASPDGAGGSSQPAAGALETLEPDATSADVEARNQPFYELVRREMAEALEAEASSGTSLALDDPGEVEALFERWLRQFHSERDDSWFTNNHTRVYKAFRPHWDEVVAAWRGGRGPKVGGTDGPQDCCPENSSPQPPQFSGRAVV